MEHKENDRINDLCGSFFFYLNHFATVFCVHVLHFQPRRKRKYVKQSVIEMYSLQSADALTE